jgi:hypothetical protein
MHCIVCTIADDFSPQVQLKGTFNSRGKTRVFEEIVTGMTNITSVKL